MSKSITWIVSFNRFDDKGPLKSITKFVEASTWNAASVLARGVFKTIKHADTFDIRPAHESDNTRLDLTVGW